MSDCANNWLGIWRGSKRSFDAFVTKLNAATKRYDRVQDPTYTIFSFVWKKSDYFVSQYFYLNCGFPTSLNWYLSKNYGLYMVLKSSRRNILRFMAKNRRKMAVFEDEK